MAATDQGFRITFLDIVKLGVMFACGLGALKLAHDRSGLWQLAAFIVGFVSLPLILWTLFSLLDRRTPG